MRKEKGGKRGRKKMDEREKESQVEERSEVITEEGSERREEEEFFLFGVLRRFQHCTGHITTGSWNGRGNQYIEFARVVYCKLPTNGKQLPAFPLKAVTGIEPPTSEVGGESVTTLPPWPPRGGGDSGRSSYWGSCGRGRREVCSAKRARVCATFTDSQEVSIVEFVKLHPELYDKEHSRFHDRTRREALWAEISAELKLQPFDVRRWFESRLYFPHFCDQK